MTRRDGAGWLMRAAIGGVLSLLTLMATLLIVTRPADLQAQAQAQAPHTRTPPPPPMQAQALAQTPTQLSRPAAPFYDEQKLSPPTHRVKMEHNVRVPMRDGVQLSTDIYRPDAPGRFPVLLWRTPYSNNSASAVEESTWYAARGYIVVAQDVRGRFDSDGTFYAFRHEADDGFDTAEWIARQPWSNGKVGTTGGSYSGYTQQTHAVRGSPGVVALTPQVSTLNIYNNWIYVDGALHYGFAFPWGAISVDGRTNQFTAAYDWPSVFPHLPIETSDEAASRRNAYYRDWVRHPERDSYWDGISFERASDYERIAIPMLNVEGWYDIFLRGAIADDIAIRARAKTKDAREGKRLVIGPWGHAPIGIRTSIPPAGPGAPAPVDPGTDFGAAAVLDVRKLYLRWFDYWLKGLDNGVATEAPIKLFVMGENVWRDEQEWPLARTRYTKYYLQSGGKANGSHGVNGDGLLTTQPPLSGAPASAAPGAANGARDRDEFTYDPTSPVPTLGGNLCCSAVPNGPWDQRRAEAREDVLVYTTPPLTEAVEVTGPITVTLFAATSARDTDWTAKLVDVHPDGYARNLQDGIVRARYRAGAGTPASPIEPGKVYAYTIDLWATSNLFLPGHRIRLEISSSNFPRFDRNLNTGEPAASGTRMVTARQTIYHSAAHPSHVTLPIIPRGETTSIAAPRTPAR